MAAVSNRLYLNLGSPLEEISGSITNSSSEVQFDTTTAEIEFYDTSSSSFISCGELIPFPYLRRYYYYNFTKVEDTWYANSTHTTFDAEDYYSAIYPHATSEFPSYTVNLTDNSTSSYKKAVLEPFIDG
eukprot:CAMPEP_0170506146 /NCGR_PEP_ID=MMETSP0208-20121228/53812_1 /TAXON_ID=197538 /ORGANISM="Strombidium inclinatum, Strain S3" /LENGTH=128 /DNA_ID=CAMNT_0010787483 /DNA_START=184 /DNA_END=567 /DNA_ORIENTATION=+